MISKVSIIKLRESGLGLKEISRMTSIPYSTVRRKCKKVKMSENGLKRYRTELNGIKRLIEIDQSLSDNKVRVMCDLMFDGSVFKSKEYHYTIMYVNSSRGLVNRFINDMKKIYNIDPSAFEEGQGTNTDYFRVKYFSKEIYDDLLKWTGTYHSSECTLPHEIMEGKREYKIIALRSFWDNEGSICKSGSLTGCLKNAKLMEQLSRLHNEFGITHSVSNHLGENWGTLRISTNINNYETFLRLGLFSHSIITKGTFIGKKKFDILKKTVKEYKKKLGFISRS